MVLFPLALVLTAFEPSLLQGAGLVDQCSVPAAVRYKTGRSQMRPSNHTDPTIPDASDDAPAPDCDATLSRDADFISGTRCLVRAPCDAANRAQRQRRARSHIACVTGSIGGARAQPVIQQPTLQWSIPCNNAARKAR